MNEKSPDITQEFSEVYPYLAGEYDRVDRHDNSSDLSSEDAMRILAEAVLPDVHLRARSTRTGSNTLFDF